MHNSLLVFLANDSARCVEAVYEPEYENPRAKRTPFKTLDPSICVGDFVVVPTETRHGMTVVKVIETDIDVDFDSIAPMKWIIAAVDRKPFEQLLRDEEGLVSAANQAEKRKKREELREKMMLNADAIRHLPIASSVEPASIAPPQES